MKKSKDKKVSDKETVLKKAFGAYTESEDAPGAFFVKKNLIELGMAVLLLTGIFFLTREGARLVSTQGKSGYTVVVDAGHGGDDPGKIGIHGELEKDINLKISMLLKELLEEKKVSVVMTRETDKDLAEELCQNRKVQDLKNRVSLISETKPDCVVSIHQNSYPEEAIKGAQVFYYETSAEGKKLADILQTHLVEALDKDNHRLAKGNDSYYLLKKTDAVMTIVECGFLSNEKEAALLSTEEYQQKVANAVCDGIIEYLEASEK